MRLAVLLDRWHPQGGGLEVYLRHVLPAMARRGHAVRLLARDARLEPPPLVEAVDVRRPWPRPWRDRAEAAAQLRLLQREGADAALGLRSVPCPGAAFLPMGGSGTHMRAARGVHGPKGGRERALAELEQRTLDCAALLLPSSPKVQREFAERRPGLPSEVLPLPLLRPARGMAPGPGAARAGGGGAGAGGSGGGGEPHLRILHCGRDPARHGAREAVAIFRALRAAGLRARLDLWSKSIRHAERRIGASATSLAREGVVLRAWQDDFLGALAEADLLLHPTLYDSFSLVCLEAVAHGVPVLTTTAAGSAELLPAALCATAPRADAAAAAATARTLLEQAGGLAASVRRDLVEEVRARFALEAHVARLESLLAQTAGGLPQG